MVQIRSISSKSIKKKDESLALNKEKKESVFISNFNKIKAKQKSNKS